MANKAKAAAIPAQSEIDTQVSELFGAYPAAKVLYRNSEGEFFDNKSYALASVNHDATLIEEFNRPEEATNTENTETI